MTDATRYPANVFWSDEDDGYIAIAPDLPGCSAFGETQQEALNELQSAIAAWIEAANAAGNPLPKPIRPVIDDSYSGKILARMPKSLHAQIAKQAKKEDVSLNQYIVFLLTFAITQQTTQSNLSIIYNIDLLTIWSKIPHEPKVSDKVLIVSDYKEIMPTGNMNIMTPEKTLMLSNLAGG